jgi:hypothetical protein
VRRLQLAKEMTMAAPRNAASFQSAGILVLQHTVTKVTNNGVDAHGAFLGLVSLLDSFAIGAPAVLLVMHPRQHIIQHRGNTATLQFF